MSATDLPEKFCDKEQIKNMEVGESLYTVPWAMSVDLDMKCHLCGTYDTTVKPQGTSCLRIERQEDGWHVHASKLTNYGAGGPYRWKPGSRIPWNGATEGDLIPVVAVD